MDAIENDPRTVNLNVVRNLTNNYDVDNQTVNWDPRASIYCPQEKNGVSPALNLFHELFHFWQWRDKKEMKPLTLLPSPEMGFDYKGKATKMHEQHAVGAENMVARELGELVRDTHYQIRDGKHQFRHPMFVADPTQHRR